MVVLICFLKGWWWQEEREMKLSCKMSLSHWLRNLFTDINKTGLVKLVGEKQRIAYVTRLGEVQKKDQIQTNKPLFISCWICDWTDDFRPRPEENIFFATIVLLPRFFSFSYPLFPCSMFMLIMMQGCCFIFFLSLSLPVVKFIWSPGAMKEVVVEIY